MGHRCWNRRVLNRNCSRVNQMASMLKRVDRVQISVPDNATAERMVAEVFGGELIRRDAVSILHAKRSTMQIGSSLIDLLQPDGAGAISDFVSKFESGL